MKISIITPTYNRSNLLGNLYNSIVKNLSYGVSIEWIIIDDGGTDDTADRVKTFDKVEVKYIHQDNQGKMAAINNGIGQATGDLIIEFDSDDIFTDDAVQIIKKAYEESKEEKDLYALCFSKIGTNGKNMGNVDVEVDNAPIAKGGMSRK